MTIDDIQFVDAVLSIPENAVKIEMTVTVYDGEKLHVAQATYHMQEIQEAIETFKDTCNGDYPLYSLTEKGREELEKYS